MVFKKKVTKSAEKMSANHECCQMAGSPCMKIKHFFVLILLLINTLMLIWVLCRQTALESNRVGGRENYKMVQQIYKLDAFKAQQKTQIQQALQMYQQPAATQPTATTQTVPAVTQ